jgi:hypothetical protein
MWHIKDSQSLQKEFMISNTTAEALVEIQYNIRLFLQPRLTTTEWLKSRLTSDIHLF